MKNRTFIEDLLQSIGFIAAIMVALSQYFLSSNFSILFIQRPELFNISNIILIVLSFSIILGVYTYRYNIETKNNKRDQYWEYQRKQKENRSQQSIKDQVSTKLSKNTHDKENKISEPWGFTVYQLAVISVFVSIAIFFVLITSQNIYLATVSYVLMICLGIFSLSVFGIKIYSAREYENRQARIYVETLNKINMYFAGKVNVKLEFTDRSNWMQEIRTMLIEHNNKTYLVKTDANNPDSYFDISEYKEEQAQNNKTL